MRVLSSRIFSFHQDFGSYLLQDSKTLGSLFNPKVGILFLLKYSENFHLSYGEVCCWWKAASIVCHLYSQLFIIKLDPAVF